MKAIVCSDFGHISHLKLGELPAPVPQADEVLIGVEAAGVNFPDVLIVQGKYQFRPTLPFAPGAEVAGTVLSVGSQVVRFAVGDRVVAATGWGGFAEQVAVPHSQVTKLPPGVESETAAALGVAYGTALHALRDRGGLQKGEQLLVLGAAGGVGVAAVQLGKLLGTSVMAAASDAEKLAVCKSAGADAVVNYSSLQWRDEVKAWGREGGVDVVLDPVGGDFTEAALRLLRPGGRLLITGFASGSIPSIPMNLPLLKVASIIGVFWSHFRKNQPEAHQQSTEWLLQQVADQQLRPMIEAVWPMSAAPEALSRLENRQVKGKLVLKWNGLDERDNT